jgi:hypothetical protein
MHASSISPQEQYRKDLTLKEAEVLALSTLKQVMEEKVRLDKNVLVVLCLCCCLACSMGLDWWHVNNIPLLVEGALISWFINE